MNIDTIALDIFKRMQGFTTKEKETFRFEYEPSTGITVVIDIEYPFPCTCKRLFPDSGIVTKDQFIYELWKQKS